MRGKDSRPPIPRAMRRAVRQKCRFQCVVCFSPLYDYEHVEEYSVVKSHSVENIVLLCPNCHRKKTRGLITKDFVRQKARLIYQRSNTASEWLEPKHYRFDIGSNVVRAYGGGVVFDVIDNGYLWIGYNGRPLINCLLWDQNGRKAVEIINNEYTFSSDIWDVEFTGTDLVMRSGARNIFASMKFDIERSMITLRAKFKINSRYFEITESGIFYDGQVLALKNVLVNCRYGIIVTADDLPVPHLFSGRVRENILIRCGGIMIRNGIEASGNVVDRCEIGFSWTKHFLSSISKAKG